MEIIKNKEHEGERPLFATHDLQLENVTIHTVRFVFGTMCWWWLTKFIANWLFRDSLIRLLLPPQRNF